MTLTDSQVAARLALADYLETKVTDAEYDHDECAPHHSKCCAQGHACRMGLLDYNSRKMILDRERVFGDGTFSEIFSEDAFNKPASKVTRTEVIARLRECGEVGS